MTEVTCTETHASLLDLIKITAEFVLNHSFKSSNIAGMTLRVFWVLFFLVLTAFQKNSVYLSAFYVCKLFLENQVNHSTKEYH